ncbi:hypothetical protein AMR42_07765 [Limnothrix sp. PR1529]|uniref:AAA family ATPase n=1 Tax=Limnothrix sp. PR1529 TaxID=1704291 RepID=UPI00081EAA07|nr:ATP/GTP-binding protein [Limnothrix sp. PR1529]OCQ92517.1 hypothetical protein BCR12_17310 [Limnothrix sp. P13C2]PIB14018.1 hypothetical protein AMR42_07765 [Limnothrix sp. PR1529]
MLLQVTLSNILSFENEITFSMVSAESENQHPDHLIHHPFKKQPPLLPIAAVYGANGAGKSNLIKAIAFAKNLITKGTRLDRRIPVPVFELSDRGKNPSKFEFVFLYEDGLYSYGFVLDSKKIFEEWLYAIMPNGKREVCLFERLTDENNGIDLKVGAVLRKNKQQAGNLQFIASGTRYNQLFLTEAANRNITLLNPVFKWFSDVLVTITAGARYSGLEIQILSSEKFKNFLGAFLKSSGTGIDSITIDELSLDLEEHLPDLPDDRRLELEQIIEDTPEESLVVLENVYGKRLLLRKEQDLSIRLMQLKTVHRHENDGLIQFPVDKESDGTRRLIDLLPALFLLQEDAERVFFIDELDRCLHPLLSRQFLKYSLECCDGETRRSQLIFTTHDTNLLDADILRRDEVWLVEKDSRGSSAIYSLVEFKITSAQLQKGYLNGRFGAIPFFGSLHSLGWISSENE